MTCKDKSWNLNFLHSVTCFPQPSPRCELALLGPQGEAIAVSSGLHLFLLCDLRAQPQICICEMGELVEGGYEHWEYLAYRLSLSLIDIIRSNLEEKFEQHCLRGVVEKLSAGKWQASSLLSANNFETGIPLSASWRKAVNVKGGSELLIVFRIKDLVASQNGEEATVFQWLLVIGSAASQDEWPMLDIPVG